MDVDREYINHFLQYLIKFVENIRDNDPLPVRAPGHRITDTEIDGQIIDIINHYLNSKYVDLLSTSP